MLPVITVNGVAGALISPLDRGFSYGDGLFETCRCIEGQIPLWAFHRERLLLSAKRLMIPVDEQLLQSYLDQILDLAKSIPDTVVKIQITRGIGGRGYRVAGDVNPTYVVGLYAGLPLETDAFNNGVEVCLCNQRLGRNSALAGLKHLNRLEYILARAEWGDEFAEGLLRDSDDNFIEATASNLFVVSRGQLLTPDLAATGVAGVMRRTIAELLAPQLGVTVQVSSLKLDDLIAADEVFLSNSVFGIWPVNQIAGLEVQLHQILVRQLQQKLLALLY